MGASGQVTRTLDVWTEPSDERVLGAAIAAVVPGAWRCSPPGALGLHPVHLHPTLAAALDCQPVQAFLSLPPVVVDRVRAFQGEPGAAVLQFLRGRVRAGVWTPGRLAVRWHRREVGDELHEQLSCWTSAALAAARRVLPAAVGVADSGEARRLGRIGPAARALVAADGLLLDRRTVETYRLR